MIGPDSGFAAPLLHNIPQNKFYFFSNEKIHMLILTVWIFKKKKKPASQTILEIGEIPGEELLG